MEAVQHRTASSFLIFPNSLFLPLLRDRLAPSLLGFWFDPKVYLARLKPNEHLAQTRQWLATSANNLPSMHCWCC